MIDTTSSFRIARALPATPRLQSRILVSPRSAEIWIDKDVGTRFGRRVKGLREQHHLTQERMATKFGIDRSFISDVERGKKSASLATPEVIALGFQITLSDLFRGI